MYLHPKQIILFALCFLLAIPSLAFAHAGTLDEYGCHYGSTGGYHCHQGELSGMRFISKTEMLKADDAKIRLEGRVVSVSEGDTIIVLTQDERQVKIRLYGIDCPESKQPFGNRATQATSDAVFGKDVIVQPIDTDRYGRTVAIVLMPNGNSLNEQLVRDGLAWVYRQHCKLEDVCAHLKELEQAAKGEKRGLWADKNPVPPWEWRRK